MNNKIIEDYHGDIKGSDKRFSFSFANKNSSTLYVFESAIDLLSLATMKLYSFGEWSDDNYLSLSGVYKKHDPNSNPSLPIALSSFLERNPQIQTINLCLDNDEVGKGSAELITELLKDEYSLKTLLPTYKDYNDDLMKLINNRRNKNIPVG